MYVYIYRVNPTMCIYVCVFVYIYTYIYTLYIHAIYINNFIYMYISSTTLTVCVVSLSFFLFLFLFSISNSLFFRFGTGGPRHSIASCHIEFDNFQYIHIYMYVYVYGYMCVCVCIYTCTRVYPVSCDVVCMFFFVGSEPADLVTASLPVKSNLTIFNVTVTDAASLIDQKMKWPPSSRAKGAAAKAR